MSSQPQNNFLAVTSGKADHIVNFLDKLRRKQTQFYKDKVRKK